MKLSPSPARVAFVVHLDGLQAGRAQPARADLARIQHLVHLFRGHHVPATWAIAAGCDLKLMQHRGLLQAGDELAIALSHNTAASPLLREWLRKRVAAMHTCTGTTVGLVAGEPIHLRNHAAFLAEQGLRGILSNTLKRHAENTYSPLPCGLWQFDTAVAIPHKSWFARLLPGSSPIQRIHKLTAKAETFLVSIDAAQVAHASTRSLQNLEKLLREVGHSASRAELSITTAGEILATLTATRISRPQHSILRAA
ncbi:MAG: hypothetical protein SH868_11020 [Bythopirellula sp.]|nr:hypothetical protein [Bythopirellula sp.]